MKHRFAALAATVAALAAAPQAHAQITNACGGDAYFSCVTVGVTGQGTSSLAFTFTNVTNNSTSIFKLFGVSNTSGVTPTGFTLSSNAGGFTSVCSIAGLGPHDPSPCGDTKSSYGNTFQGNGLTGDFFGLLATNPGAGAGSTDLAVNQSATFTLVFDNPDAAAAFLGHNTSANGPMDYAIFDQGGANCSGSNKADFNSNGSPRTGSANPTGTCGGPPITSTPEPSSLALLGTGLFGLVPMVRRRRK